MRGNGQDPLFEIWSSGLQPSPRGEHDDDGNPTMNNKNISSYSSDPDARYGAKGKNKIWVGYKRHLSVDMHQGFITKVAVTPANVHDGQGLKHVCPRSGAVVADKAYFGGKTKTQFQAFFEGLVHNIKRLIAINATPIPI